MCNHRVKQQSNLVTCGDCSFRAIITNDNRMFVTEPGDATADHRAAVLATQQQARDTAAQIMTRLRGQYASRAAFDGQALTLQQLQRLYRCVAGEFV